MYAGYGSWNICDGCGEIMHPAQVEYEVTYPDDRVYRLHFGCAGLWEAECREYGTRSS
jgi:hypothetical protein